MVADSTDLTGDSLFDSIFDNLTSNLLKYPADADRATESPASPPIID
jgi:hypothetical protein